jgi:hypothetical protein
LPRKRTPGVDSTIAYPTRGDLAREQLRRRGLSYDGDILDHIEERLMRLAAEGRTAFAAACAERLLAAHAALPPTEQRPFTMEWRPVLDALWEALMGNSAADRRVRTALDRFHAGPYDHADGQDGPNDADEDAAAACILAAESHAAGEPEAAYGAAVRAIERAYRVAEDELRLDSNDFEWDPAADPPMPLARESMHPAVQNELRRLQADLALIERDGAVVSTIEALRRPAEHR